MQEKLAVMDWGIGGMGFFRHWKRRFPLHGLVYFSDRGFTPYGLLDDEAMRARLAEVVGYLKKEHKVSAIMVACNAASTMVDSDLVKQGVHGVIEPTVRWMKKKFTSKDRIIVIGGNRIAKGRIFSKSLPELAIQEVVAQPLSALVERGLTSGAEVEAALHLVLGDLEGGSHVVLACTHYVELLKPMQRLFPQLFFHDPVPFVMQALVEKGDSYSSGEDVFFTTGEVKSERWIQVYLS